jgi:hypothetical protein
VSVQHHYFRGPANDLDTDALIRFGPLLAVEVHLPAAIARAMEARGESVPAPISGWGMVDTGAGRTGVDAGVIASLGLNPLNAVSVATAAGVSFQPLFPAALLFPGLAGVTVEFESVLGLDLGGTSRRTALRSSASWGGMSSLRGYSSTTARSECGRSL